MWPVRTIFFLLILLSVSSAGGAVLAQPSLELEYRVKAAFLYNFAKFTEWPAEYLGNAGQPIDVCVLGDDPFGRILDDTLEGKKIENRDIRLSRISAASQAEGCEILFMAYSEFERTGSVLSALSRKPILTVGEPGDFVREGGIIRFLIEDNKIRFEINLNAARKAGIKLSSKLLRVASAVRNADAS